MRKILIITATLNYGGVERLLIDVVNALGEDNGYKLTICNITGSGELVDDIKSTRVAYVPLNQKILKKNILTTILKMRGLIRDTNPDIIHTHQFASNFYGSVSAVGLKIPVIFHLYNPQMEAWSRRIIRWIISKILINNFIVETEKQKGLIAKSKISRNKISVLYNTLDPRRMIVPKNHNMEEYRKQFNIPRNALVVGGVGRLIYKKGYDMLIQAVEQMVLDGLNIFLIIVGDGPEKSNLDSLAKKIGVGDLVAITGFRNDVVNLMNLFDVFVVSSRTESFPIVAIEAMFLKKPVIITDKLLSRDILAPAVLVVPATISGIKEGVVSLYHDKQKRAELSEKGKNLADDKFSIDKYMEKLKIIYDNIVMQKL